MFTKIINKLFNSNDNAISFKQGFELTDLPICTFYQNGKKLNFLLDTGSTDNVIDSNALGMIEHSKVENMKSNLYGLDGNKTEVPVCEITLQYKDNNYSFIYLISDMKTAFGNIKAESGVNLHGIIGSKFFNEFQYVLDFKELIAYSKL